MDPIETNSNKLIKVPRDVLDTQIKERLEKIANATGDFQKNTIEVKEGVVFLRGISVDDTSVEWIKDVSLRTEGVVAFMDKSEISVPEVSIDSTSKEFTSIKEKTEGLLPYLAISGITLSVFILLTFAVTWFGRNILFRNYDNYFARKTLARVVAIPFFALGLYLTFKVSGLTNLAVTVIGGTGLVGLAIGFAMKGVFENFFSSMILSLRGQFNKGDFIGIEGEVGVIQSISSQGTTIMDLDGNNIFVPNSKFMTSIFKNYTLNPNMRVSFVLGIGYEDNISKAQDIILRELDRLSEVVLKDPAPSVSVKVLASATVNLETHFWINYKSISDKKALSVVQKMVKVALMSEGISMPDDAREIVFANSLSINKDDSVAKSENEMHDNTRIVQQENIDHSELTNDIAEIEQQALELDQKLSKKEGSELT